MYGPEQTVLKQKFNLKEKRKKYYGNEQQGPTTRTTLLIKATI